MQTVHTNTTPGNCPPPADLPVYCLNEIRNLQATCHHDAVRAGWWHGPNGERKNLNVAERICLMHSELSEAMEGARKDLMDDKLPHRSMLEVELVDVIIRVMDFAGAAELDLAGAIQEKLAFNRERADHKPENRAKEGGKKF